MASVKQDCVHYDAMIIGGGAVGTTLAAALVQRGFSVVLVDSHSPDDRADASKDNRIFALAAGTQVVLDKLGLWPYMQQKATKIERIHVSNKGSFGVSRLSADDFALNALGYMIAASDMQQALNQAVAQLEVSSQGAGCFQQYFPATLTDFVQSQDKMSVTATINTAEGDIHLSSKLFIAADGTQSSIRKKLEIQTQQKHYQQRALVAKIGLDQAHEFTAYERFINDGAIALLPYQHNQCALIWSAADVSIDRLMAMSDASFLETLQEAFGYRLGAFVSVSPRFSYPLVETKALQICQDNVVLIGNAAQTLHPIAAQGFNLALRHIALLTALLTKSQQESKSLDIPAILKAYQAMQKPDTEHTLFFTNALVRFFSEDWLGKSKTLRAGLLSAFELLPPVQRHLLKGVMKGA